MPSARVVLPFLVLAGACGCSTLRVQYDYDPRADFTTLETYAWLEAPVQPAGDPRADSQLLHSRVERAVDEVLASKGYLKRAPGGADFLLGYYVTLDRKVDVSVVDGYHGYGPGPGWGSYGWVRSSEVYVDQYDEGTLILDIINSSTEKLMWRGMAIDRVEFSAGPEQRAERVRQAVEKMLESFPPPMEGKKA